MGTRKYTIVLFFFTHMHSKKRDTHAEEKPNTRRVIFRKQTREGEKKEKDLQRNKKRKPRRERKKTQQNNERYGIDVYYFVGVVRSFPLHDTHTGEERVVEREVRTNRCFLGEEKPQAGSN